MAKTVDISEARQNLTRLGASLNRGGERVVRVTRYGRETLAIVNIEYFDALLETLEILADPQAIKQLQASLEDIGNGRLHDHKAVKAELY